MCLIVKELEKQISDLKDKINELEGLCEETYVRFGADAYNHACSELDRFQKSRVDSDKYPGTTGSLCDGMSSLYSYIESLESKILDLESTIEELFQILNFH